jgi:ferredoxin
MFNNDGILAKFMSVRILFLPDDVTIDAEVGEPLLDVAERAGVSIPTGCLMGSCHACEVEIDGGATVCSCITAVPPGREKLTINLDFDPTW